MLNVSQLFIGTNIIKLVILSLILQIISFISVIVFIIAWHASNVILLIGLLSIVVGVFVGIVMTISVMWYINNHENGEYDVGPQD